MEINQVLFSIGATAAIQAPADDHTFDFTHIEIYGGAHLWVNGTRTKIETQRIYGDDTGHFHIGPNQTLEITEVLKNLHFGDATTMTYLDQVFLDE